MKIEVYLTAFAREGEPVKVRPVLIPDETPESEMLETVFYLGQNEFQPVDGCYSVSAGDVVKLPDGSLHRVAMAGFEALPADTDTASLPIGMEAQFPNVRRRAPA